MVAAGMGLLWAGYAISLFGWCLLRDYDITFGQLVSPIHPYAGAWPPAKIPVGQIWPGKATAATSAGTGSGLSRQQLSASAAGGALA
jgi:hypothetical protein